MEHCQNIFSNMMELRNLLSDLNNHLVSKPVINLAMRPASEKHKITKGHKVCTFVHPRG